AHSPASSAISIFLFAGERHALLLEDEHRIVRQIRKMPFEGRKGGAFWQATLSIAPRVKRHCVMGGEKRSRMNSFKNHRMLPQRVIERARPRRDSNIGPLKPAEDLCLRGHVD